METRNNICRCNQNGRNQYDRNLYDRNLYDRNQYDRNQYDRNLYDRIQQYENSAYNKKTFPHHTSTLLYTFKLAALRNYYSSALT